MSDQSKSGRRTPQSQSIPAKDKNLLWVEVQCVDCLEEETWKRTYIRGFGFSIPAVAGIVSHLVVHVLPETQLVFGHTNFSKVEVDPPDEISQDGVIDHSLNETDN